VPRLASSQPLVSFDLPFPLEDRIDSSCIVEAYVYPAIPSQRKNDKGRHICQAHDGFYTRIIYYGREKKGLGDLSKAHFEDPIRANEDFTLYNGKGSLRKVFS
jgi:hypothetical protein